MFLRPEAYNFIENETLAQVLFCEFCGCFTIYDIPDNL